MLHVRYLPDGHSAKRSPCLMFVLADGHPARRSLCLKFNLTDGHSVCLPVYLHDGHSAWRSLCCLPVYLPDGHSARQSHCFSVFIAWRSFCLKFILTFIIPVTYSGGILWRIWLSARTTCVSVLSVWFLDSIVLSPWYYSVKFFHLFSSFLFLVAIFISNFRLTLFKNNDQQCYTEAVASNFSF
jgi:hypothetical protein